MDTVKFTAGGPRPGSVVFYVMDGAVRRGRVHSVEAVLGADDEPEHPRVTVCVGWFDRDGDPCRSYLHPNEVFSGAVQACNEVFGSTPEPELS